MKKRIVELSFMCICLVMVLCECSRRIENAELVDVYADGPVTAPLDSIFSSIFGNDGPGGIVMVMQGDSVVYERAFGYADMETREPITDRTLFNIASCSKFFAAAALLKLEEQELVSIDDSLSVYFPDFPSDVFGHITLRHILTHSSGLPDLRPHDESEWENYLREQSSVFGISRDYRLYGTEKEHSQVFKLLKSLEFEPGTTYQINDPGYVLIAPIIEKVTGVEYTRWVADNLFAPAEMSDAFYLIPGERSPRSAHGYTPDSSGAWKEYDYGEAEFFLTKADRGMFASMRDFRNWFHALCGGKILSMASRTAMTTPYVKGKDDTYFGLGALIFCTPDRPRKACHLRTNGGFTAVEATWPDRDIHYVILSNRNDWDYKRVMDEIDSIFEEQEWI